MKRASQFIICLTLIFSLALSQLTFAESPIETSRININTATVEELTELKGIGQKKAMAIIKYRETQGEIKSLEDLKDVTGIGEAIIQKNINQIAFE